MKISLSRKGFDSTYGGCPSPILPDGTLLSMPIPTEYSQTKFSDIAYNGKTYDEIWKELSPKKYTSDSCCHLDPDIRAGIRKCEVLKWRPVFGQTGAAQSHLNNMRIGVNDIFLFFGLYRKVNKVNGVYKYDASSQPVHLIYGYFQVGEIVIGEEIAQYYWHPHSQDGYDANNTVYLPTDKLTIDGEKTNFSGYGTFDFSDKLVLTADGMSVTKWKVPDWFKTVNISYHNPKSFKDNYFQSRSRGQEFVIEDNVNNAKLIKSLLGI